MIADFSSNLLIGTSPLGGPSYSSTDWMNTGATYRPNDERFPTACQYWQPPYLLYMNSGYNEYVTGVGVNLWEGSKACGQCLQVVNGVKSINVVIADYCPPPCTPHQLDLNPIASQALNLKFSKPSNYIGLKVRKVKCNWLPELTFYLDKGSSVYNWYMIPLFQVEPLKSVTVLGHVGVHDLYGRWVIAFKTKFPTCGDEVLVAVNNGSQSVKFHFNCANVPPFPSRNKHFQIQAS